MPPRESCGECRVELRLAGNRATAHAPPRGLQATPPGLTALRPLRDRVFSR